MKNVFQLNNFQSSYLIQSTDIICYLDYYVEHITYEDWQKSSEMEVRNMFLKQKTNRL